MKKYEKHTLIKFTLIYFLSTAFFVIILGYLYYKEQSNLIIQENTIKMHQYLIKLKQSHLAYSQKNYSYKFCKSGKNHYDLAKKNGNHYEKSFPLQMGKGCITVVLNGKIIDNELNQIKYFILSLQVALLIFFLIIGYILAKMSLKPVQENISHMDRFIKDLIHDLNTPISSILLNLQILQLEQDKKFQKPIKRIEQSLKQITSLYDNLEIVLQRTLQKEYIDLYEIFEQKKEDISMRYPKITFSIKTKEMKVKTNYQSIKRILDNILSNSCKYSNDIDPYIKIDFKDNLLIIEDNGKGIKYPQKVFERSYSEHDNGHGIGMHIVQRLCNELNIKINIISIQQQGTKVELFIK